MSTRRIITGTKLSLTRSDGRKLLLGENEAYEIYSIKGLGIGEIERETGGNALTDGELWLGSKVINRVVELETAWNTANQRTAFMDFFQHNMRFDALLEFNGSRYHGSCVLDEAYDAEQHGGNLYSGSGIELSLYFPDPHLYTDAVYQYQIGRDLFFHTKFYNDPADHGRAIRPDEAYYFSIFTSPLEHNITNPSSTPNGIEVVIAASGDVVNPKIENATTGLHLQLNYTLHAGDTLYINTQSGFMKAVVNGADVLRHLTMPSRMIQAASGNNIITFVPDSGAENATCEITFRGKVLAI